MSFDFAQFFVLITEVSDKIINVIFRLMNYPVSNLSNLISGQAVLSCTTFSGIPFTYNFPHISFVSNILSFIVDVLFSPAFYLNSSLNIDMPIIYAMFCLVIWYPVIVGFGKLAKLVIEIINPF